MDLHAALDAPCPPEVLFAHVDDLSAYPAWLSIVPRAERAPAAEGDPGPAWLVELRGRLGPLARSKRLRMVRVACQPPDHVRFERRETDDRQHAAWRLEARVIAASPRAGSRLEMQLHYGGGFGEPVVRRLLQDEIEQSRPRLLGLVSGDGAAGADVSA